MARPKKYPDYDPDKIMNDLLDVVVEEYKKSLKTTDKKGEIKSIAAELDVTPHKTRKLLITAGIRDGEEYYCSSRYREIMSLYNEGKSISDIMAVTGLNRTSVCCYLPYIKGLYNAKEISVDAERVRRYRSRQERCESFMSNIKGMDRRAAEEYLWDTLQYLEGCVFRTIGRGKHKGIDFKYEIKGGEMFVNRKKKSITRSTVNMAFWKARTIQTQEGCVSGPKRLGTFGASYLYPIFLRLNICVQDQE